MVARRDDGVNFIGVAGGVGTCPHVLGSGVTSEAQFHHSKGGTMKRRRQWRLGIPLAALLAVTVIFSLG